MSNNNVLYAGAGEGGNRLDFAPTSEYIGMALEEYYNWVNNTVLYNSVTPNLKPFFRKVENWERWINGYVPEFHDFNRGVIPTHLAKSIVDKVSALIWGGGFMLQSTGDKKSENKNEALEFASEWAKDINLSEAVQSTIRFAVGLGTASLKLNSDGNKQLWIEAVPLSRSRYEFDARGNVRRAAFFIQSFNRGSTVKDGDTYGLYEERYFGEDNKPKCEYKVYRINLQCNQAQNAQSDVYIPWEDIPAWVRRQLKESFYAIRLDTPITLPFTNIGVYIYRYTPCLSSMPHLRYGDSVLEGLTKYLCEYDILSACIDTEMYVSRARVMAKKQVQNPQKANYNSGIDSFMLTYYEEMGNDPKPLLFIQPEIRAEHLKSLRNATLENICTAVGIAPSSFASYLNDSSNRTAREVSAEESATTLLVENKRVSLVSILNNLIADVMRYFGHPADIEAEFSKAGQTNYTLLVENAVKIRQAGGSSLEQFVRTVNPSFDESQVQREIELIRKEEAERSSAQANSIFGNMDTGTDIEESFPE